MDAPTPTPVTEPAEPPSAPTTRRPRRRTLAAAGVAGTVAVASLGLASLRADDTTGTASTNRNDRTVADLVRDADDLGTVTLDDLADQLAELGLEVTIAPADATVDGGDEPDEPASPAVEPDDTAVETDEPASPAGEPGDDPFAGMTDAEIDALSDEEFFSMLEEAGWTVDDDGWIVPEGEADGSFDGDHDHHDGAFDETAAVFTVDGDRITPTTGDADAVAEGEAIWRRFVELIPAEQRQMLIGFEVIAERGGGGYVYPDDNDPTKWHMGISPGLGADEDWVLIHEFAHLLTLQAEEVPPSFDDGSCPTYHTGEGCSLKSSTMNEFVERFWPRAQIDEIFSAQENEDWDALDRFYEEHRDDFVTDYATTNPAEDLAETFTVFVLNDRPTGDTIADQKIEFLWNDADMVELRERIRTAL
ncbi:MAG: hypothetical protein AAGA90_04185 [Actinomycetota bacterium]